MLIAVVFHTRVRYTDRPVMVALAVQNQGRDQSSENQYPVGDLRPGREHEPFRTGIRARALGRDSGRHPGRQLTR